MLLTTIFAMTFVLGVKSQKIYVQELTNNNGYIPIKTGELKTINHYDKLLHFINLTTYEDTMLRIMDNINILKTTSSGDSQNPLPKIFYY